MTHAKAYETVSTRRLSWFPVQVEGCRIGTLAGFDHGYVFYASATPLRAFDGCAFPDRDEAQRVLAGAARRFGVAGGRAGSDREAA